MNLLNLLIQILVEKSMNRSASNSNIESTQAGAKLITNRFNNYPKNTIQLVFAHLGVAISYQLAMMWIVIVYASQLQHIDRTILRTGVDDSIRFA
jgi:hypothetical protein